MLLPAVTALASALSLLPAARGGDIILPGPAQALLTGPDIHFPNGLPSGVNLNPPWSQAEREWAGAPVITCRSCRVPWPPEESAVVEDVQGGMRISTWIGSQPGAVPTPVAGGLELTELLDSARVLIRSADHERECVRAFGRFRCGPEDWLWVGLSTVRIQDRDESCIWMHPTSEGTLVLRWDSLTRTGIVRGRAGVSDQAAATGRESTVDLSVVVDGTSALQEQFRFERGLQSWRVSLPAGGPTMQLALEVSAADVGMAHFCVTGSLSGQPESATEQAQVRRSPPARSERALRRAWGNRIRTFLFGDRARANRPPRTRSLADDISPARRERPRLEHEGSSTQETP